MWLSRYFLWFLGFGLLGWVYETCYVTIKEKKWSNRGFLFGPVLPIYGAGAALICAVVEFVLKDGYTWWQIFLISYLGSVVLEYSTHWTLEKLFHAYWWDYRDMPLNINGRVCVPASIAFGLAGLLVVYVLYPAAEALTAGISPVVMELLALLGMAVIAADTALTVAALTNFENMVRSAQDALNAHMERYVATAADAAQNAAARIDEERERFFEKTVAHMAGHANAAYRSALKRVKGLRLENMPSGEGAKQSAQALFERLTRRVRETAGVVRTALTPDRGPEEAYLEPEELAAKLAAETGAEQEKPAAGKNEAGTKQGGED